MHLAKYFRNKLIVLNNVWKGKLNQKSWDWSLHVHVKKTTGSQATFIYQIIAACILTLFILHILLSISRCISSKPWILCLCKALGKEILIFSSLVEQKTNTVPTSDTDSHCSSSGRKEPSCASFLPCYPDQSRRQVGQGAPALHCDTNPQSHYIPRLKPITNTDC